MNLTVNFDNDLTLYYRIRYDTWDIEYSFYVRASLYTKDEALALFKHKFPSIDGLLLCDIVIIHRISSLK